jgi:hypothetical protein
MNFAAWEPVYEAIVADFGFDRRADTDARDLIASLTGSFDPGRLPDVEGRAVAIAGGASSLWEELGVAREADVVFAASSAAGVLREAGVEVHLMTTDVDKIPATARELTREGVPVAVHAHGDNVAAVREWVPRFDPAWTLPTTQVEPTAEVANFGGFTDGDRAAFLADHFGAARLTFPGWDFDDLDVDPAKRRKLRWAERLLAWLERRRGEEFPVLAGRRESLEPVT